MDFRPVTLKKNKVIFQKIHDPGYAKKNQKMRNLYKNFFATEQPKKLQNTSLTQYVEFQMDFRPVTLKEEQSHFFKKSMTPDMRKNSINGKFKKKIFFARNNLKSFKIRP